MAKRRKPKTRNQILTELAMANMNLNAARLSVRNVRRTALRELLAAAEIFRAAKLFSNARRVREVVREIAHQTTAYVPDHERGPFDKKDDEIPF